MRGASAQCGSLAQASFPNRMDFRLKIRRGFVNGRWKGVGWPGRHKGATGLAPCRLPCRGNACRGFAEARMRGVPGQAVPGGKRSRSGDPRHGSSATPKPPPILGMKGAPLGFCGKHTWHHGVAFRQDVPRGPCGVKRRARAACTRGGVRLTQQPFHGVRFPQGVHPALPRSLAVVVGTCVQRHVRVAEVMAEVGGQPFNARHVEGVGRQGRHEPAVAPLDLPRKDAYVCEGVARGVSHQRISLCMGATPRNGQAVARVDGQVVHVEVMSGRLQGVGVFAGIGVGCTPHKLRRSGMPRITHGARKHFPRGCVQGFVGSKPPPDNPQCGGCAQRQGSGVKPPTPIRNPRRLFQRVQGSIEPKNRFSARGWRCNCWASGSTSRLRSNSTCATSCGGKKPLKRQTCCRGRT